MYQSNRDVVYGSFPSILNINTKNSKEKEKLKNILNRRNLAKFSVLKYHILLLNKGIRW